MEHFKRLRSMDSQLATISDASSSKDEHIESIQGRCSTMMDIMYINKMEKAGLEQEEVGIRSSIKNYSPDEESVLRQSKISDAKEKDELEKAIIEKSIELENF